MIKREQLLFYALKYKGNYNLITQAILKNETWEKQDDTITHYLTILDENYPFPLLNLRNPPFVLFYKGDISLINKRMCSIVGGRIACTYAKEFTEFAVEKLAEEYIIVSGLAKGIDGIAHQTALHHGKTIGILGSGIDRCYPKENHCIYNCMSIDHLLISEYPGEIEPKKVHFPFRNRLIAALGEFLLVTQAQVRSGTMITVNEALELGKEVYTIPYPIHDINGEGCNLLIEQGAQIILSKHDFISKLVDKREKIIQYKKRFGGIS